jgi:predicted acetyltransferase
MPKTPEKPPAQIELVHAAPEHAPILANLLELYMHDFSEFYSVEIGADGKFSYPSLTSYWSEPDRFPFLVKTVGNLAGLALVKLSSAAVGTGKVWDVAEFFVLRAYRRQGLGTRLAHQLWRQFPGPWEVRVMRSNVAGGKFWRQAIRAFTGSRVGPRLVKKDGVSWHVFAFESRQSKRR